MSEGTFKEYMIHNWDGSVLKEIVPEDVYRDETLMKIRITNLRETLRGYAIPEEYWPILVVQEVTTTRSSWRPLDE